MKIERKKERNMFRLQHPSSRSTFVLLTSTILETHQLTKPHHTNLKTIITSTKCHAPKLSSELSTNDDIDWYSKWGVRRDLMPKHVKIILDGSRRWHKQHGKPLSYVPFFEANLVFANLCLKFGIPTASTFIYGIQTCRRGKEANDLVFGSFERWLNQNLEDFSRKGVQVSIKGERSFLPKSLNETIQEVEKSTKNNSKLEFMLGVCFEGKNEIMQATKIICEKVRAGKIDPDTVDESLIERHLSTKNLKNPNPDLLIRTGGGLLLSNTWLWQSANTELYFTPIYAPDFSEDEFIKALLSFQSRERAFDK